MTGNKKTINGINYYAYDFNGEGFIFKDEDAFENDKDAVCYIPEHAFDDVEYVKIDGEDYYREDNLECYTRADLEAMVDEFNNDHEFEDDEEPLCVEYFFESLEWCSPETRLLELDY